MKRIGQFIIVLLFVAPLPAFAQSDAWRWESSRMPKARVYEGLWSEFFRVDPALHDAGIPSTLVPISALPKEDAGLAQDSVIVLVNTAAPHLTEARVARIKAFVEAGGGLVVLAGQSAYRRGGYSGTPLAEMLPVTFPVEGGLWPLPQGVPLTRAASATWLPAMDFSAHPTTFFLESFTPKPGAVVQLMAGDKPAIVSGTFGKGRVVAVAVMVNGQSTAGQLAFWEWPQWPHLLGAAIDWSAGNRPLKVAESPVAIAKPVTDEEVKELHLGMKLPADLLARARAHPNAEIAQALFDYALSRDAATKVTFSQILPIVLHFAKPDWGPRLAERTVMNADREDRNASFVLLGATRWPGATPYLLRALSQAETLAPAIEGLGYTGDASVLPQLRATYEGAMNAAELPGEPQWLNPEGFAKVHAAIATEAALALFRLGDSTGLERVLAMHRRVHLYWDVYHVAGRRNIKWEDPKQVAELHAIWEREQNLAAVLKKLQPGDDPLPANQLAAFVKAAQSDVDVVDVEWMLGEMQASLAAFPPSTWQPLTSAKDGIITRFARVAIAESGRSTQLPGN